MFQVYNYKSKILTLTLVFLYCLTGCSNKNQSSSSNDIETALLQDPFEENGRYQMVFLPPIKQFDPPLEPQIVVLDTKRGLIWQYEVQFVEERARYAAQELGLTSHSSPSMNRLELRGFADVKFDALRKAIFRDTSELTGQLQPKWWPLVRDSLNQQELRKIFRARTTNWPAVVK